MNKKVGEEEDFVEFDRPKRRVVGALLAHVENQLFEPLLIFGPVLGSP